jgi:hypothetical protein
MNMQCSRSLEVKVNCSLYGELGIVGIPRVYWYGEEAGSNILVMELLDYNIEEIYNKQLKR